MHYLQVSLTTGRERAGQIGDILEELGALSVTIQSADDEQSFDAALPGEPRWSRQSMVALFPSDRSKLELTAALSPWLGGSGPDFSTLEDRDWERAWLDQFEPLRVREDLWVVPSWIDPPRPDAINLVIDPGLAFGTGTHPTTRMCLEHLSSLDLSGKLVVDYGCGSGILAIAAIALGAEKAIATDTDPRALDATRTNADINQCGDRAVVTDPLSLDNSCEHRADVLIANILAPTLEELRDRLLGLLRPGGMLLLSGILSSQADRVRQCFTESLVFSCHTRGDWVLLAGTRDVSATRRIA
jgi:ribosomal protein L11 methyltransferase